MTWAKEVVDFLRMSIDVPGDGRSTRLGYFYDSWGIDVLIFYQTGANRIENTQICWLGCREVQLLELERLLLELKTHWWADMAAALLHTHRVAKAYRTVVNPGNFLFDERQNLMMCD